MYGIPCFLKVLRCIPRNVIGHETGYPQLTGHARSVGSFAVARPDVSRRIFAQRFSALRQDVFSFCVGRLGSKNLPCAVSRNRGRSHPMPKHYCCWYYRCCCYYRNWPQNQNSIENALITLFYSLPSFLDFLSSIRSLIFLLALRQPFSNLISYCIRST